MKNLTRRDFIKLCGTSTVGLALAACGVSPTPTTTPAHTSTALPTTTPLSTNTPLPTATATLGIPPVPTSTAMATGTATLQVPTLRGYADKAGVKIGTQFTGRWFSDTKWQGIVAREFNQATVDWGIYWSDSEPSRNLFEFGVADRVIAFAEKNKMRIRGHALVYRFPNVVPNWLTQGNYSRDEMQQVIRNHITRIMGRYKGRVSEWVVVNEPYNPPYHKSDVFFQAMGYDYIDYAFQIAREVDPSAVLIYNNANNETKNGIMTKLTQENVARLKSKGLIDVVGLEMHIDGTRLPAKDDLVATMKSYGLPTYVTEFDVDIKDIPGTQEERYRKQSDIYGLLLTTVLESGICRNITVWGIGDKHSFLEQQNRNADPTMFDDEMNPKPAYFAVLEVLQKFA